MNFDVIDVDEDGIGFEGEEIGLVASPEAVAAGWMINKPVVLNFPDGSKAFSTQPVITPAGMEKFSREYPLQFRGSEGEA